MSASRRAHVVPGTLAGFTYQFHRALHWLSRAPPGARVGVETDDDVAVEFRGGRRLREQSKRSILPTGQPFGDHSRALWRTLQIWLQAILDGELDLGNAALYMVTNRPVGDCIARHIGQADSLAAAEECLRELRDAGASAPAGVRSLCDWVLGREPTLLRSLITRVQCVDAAEPADTPETRAQLAGYLQIPAYLDSDTIIDGLLGWLMSACGECWGRRVPAWIPKEAFAAQRDSIVSQMRRERRRERPAWVLVVSDSEVAGERARQFVRQMELISVGHDELEDAIRDFIRCNRERLRLSSDGEVLQNAWVDFDDRLERRWKMVRNRHLRLDPPQPADGLGYAIFSDCAHQHREVLAGEPTDEFYLTAGSYHRLADLLIVGWHPDYRRLLLSTEGDDDGLDY